MKKVTLAIIAVTLAKLVPAAAEDWVIKRLDTESRRGVYCSLAFDNRNHPVVAYMENVKDDSDLLLARFDGTKWNYEKVDTEGNTGYFADVAVDGAGHPHISYVHFISFPDPEKAELRYARYDGTKWHVEVVDKAGVESVRGTSIAIDSHNHPHISYTNREAYDKVRLKYAYHDGTQWRISVVEPWGTAGICNALAVDSKNRPHISYVDGSRTAPASKYAYYNGSSWKITTIEKGTGPKRETSIAVDNKDRPHISYLQDTEDDLIYATFDGSRWHVTTVDHEARVDYFTSIAVDRTNRPHISYTDGIPPTCSLKYAYFDGSKWHKEYVEEGSDLGTYNAIALDKKGKPHIAYFEGAEADDLKYAYRRCGIGISVGEFNAVPRGDAIALRWTTDAAAAGFNLYREAAAGARDAGNAASVKINGKLITGRSPYLYLDHDVELGATYRYWLEVIELAGPAERHGPAECMMTPPPRTFTLSQNFPNPARANTNIAFAVPDVCDAVISLYDLSGRKVKTVSVKAAAGENQLDVNVTALTPGIYTYRLEAGGNAATRRMVVVK